MRPSGFARIIPIPATQESQSKPGQAAPLLLVHAEAAWPGYAARAVLLDSRNAGLLPDQEWIAYKNGRLDKPTRCSYHVHELLEQGGEHDDTDRSIHRNAHLKLLPSPIHVRHTAGNALGVLVHDIGGSLHSFFLSAPTDALPMQGEGVIELSVSSLGDFVDVAVLTQYCAWYYAACFVNGNHMGSEVADYLHYARQFAPEPPFCFPAQMVTAQGDVPCVLRLLERVLATGSDASCCFRARWYYQASGESIVSGLVLQRRVEWQQGGEWKQMQAPLGRIVAVDSLAPL